MIDPVKLLDDNIIEAVRKSFFAYGSCLTDACAQLPCPCAETVARAAIAVVLASRGENKP